MASTEQIFDTDVRITGKLKVHGQVEAPGWEVLWSGVPAQSGMSLVGGNTARNYTIDQMISLLDASGYNYGRFNADGLLYGATHVSTTGPLILNHGPASPNAAIGFVRRDVLIDIASS